MRKTFTFLILLSSLLTYGQIEIKVSKIKSDSVSIQFPENMKIKVGTEYEFIYKTNVQLSDSLKESLSYQYLHDGLKVKAKIDHYERGINITSKVKNETKNTYDVGHNMFYIDGTEKWKVKIDGQYISRYISNDIKSNSIVEIELQSDNYDLSKAKYQEPIILFWMANQSSYEKFEFNGSKVRIDLSKHPDFINGLNKNEKHNAIVILLPQVKVKRKKLFSDEQKKRMYIMRYVK